MRRLSVCGEAELRFWWVAFEAADQLFDRTCTTMVDVTKLAFSSAKSSSQTCIDPMRRVLLLAWRFLILLQNPADMLFQRTEPGLFPIHLLPLGRQRTGYRLPDLLPTDHPGILSIRHVQGGANLDERTPSHDPISAELNRSASMAAAGAIPKAGPDAYDHVDGILNYGRTKVPCNRPRLFPSPRSVFLRLSSLGAEGYSRMCPLSA